MRLCMTLLVRDEAGLVRENIEYHLSRGVDFVIATDNLSVDATPEILRGYERRGLLRYIREEGDDYSQDLWVTRMARLAAREHGAEWVLHVDADEFWWPERVEDLKDILSGVPAGVDGLRVDRSNFVGSAAYTRDEPFHAQLRCRQAAATNAIGNPLPGKVCHRGFERVRVGQGNHDFTLPSRSPKILQTDEIAIFHFPYRSYEEFRHKIRLGGAAYERNARLPPRVGGPWRSLYAQERAGRLEEHFRGLIAGHDELAALVKTGAAIHDPRFDDYMQGLSR